MRRLRILTKYGQVRTSVDSLQAQVHPRIVFRTAVLSLKFTVGAI